MTHLQIRSESEICALAGKELENVFLVQGSHGHGRTAPNRDRVKQAGGERGRHAGVSELRDKKRGGGEKEGVN